MNKNIAIHAKHKSLSAVAAFFLLFSFACSSSPAAPASSTPSATASQTPSSTPVPSPIPSLTPTVTATPVPPLLPKAGRVVRSEHFDSPATLSFPMETVGDMEIKDGLLILTDPISTTGNPWADGHVALRSKFSPKVGHVSVFSFRAEKNTHFGFHYELYKYTNKGTLYRGINLDCCLPGVGLNIDQGYGDNHATQRSMPVSRFRHGIWYLYALQVQRGGFVTAQIWERDQPATPIFERSFQLDEGWTTPGFTIIIAVNQGKMEVDEYQEVELTETK